MTDEIKLLPCPFCNGTNVIPDFSLGYKAGDETKPVIAAGCFDCSATGPDVEVPKDTNGYIEAAEKWNDRAENRAAMANGDLE